MIYSEIMKKENNNKTQIFHYDLYGKREDKYDFLNNNSINSINWNNLEPEEPNFFFVPKDFGEQESYEKGFSIQEIFNVFGSGIKTERDFLTIQFNINDIKSIIHDFLFENEIKLKSKYKIQEDSRDWKLSSAKADVIKNFKENLFQKIHYRVFDYRFTFYTGTTRGFIGTPSSKLSKNLTKENWALIFKKSRILGDQNIYRHVSISNRITDINFLADQSYVFPLYLYPDSIGESNNTNSRTPNLNIDIVNKIAKGLGLTFTPEIVGTNRDLSEKKYNYENKRTGLDLSLRDENVESMRTGLDLSLREIKNDSDEFQRTGHDLSLQEIKNTFAPIDILDYIYAVLHSPTYREKYKEFLKIDFPRVPYPHNVGTNRDLSAIQNKFWQLVKLGGELRQIHLLESAVVEHYITQYPIDGNNEVEKPVFKDGKVFINDTQYFANVPEVAWNFYIGGYQPAQKWLKDRKGRKLDFDDIFHYQKIIVALTETDRIMKEIDEIEIE